MKISLDSYEDILTHNINELSKKSEEVFSDFLKLDDFDAILEKTLNSLSDAEKEAHLKTIEELERNGLDKEQINLINLYVLNKKEFPDMEMKVNEKEQKLIDEYELTFDDIYGAIQDKRKKDLSYKPLKAEMIVTDTLLKVQDEVNNKPVKDYKLNIEV